MGLTLQEALVTALKKLEDSSFQRFIEKLSVWEVRKEYKKIPKDELFGRDPEHVAGLINEYYKYAYGAQVTLNVLDNIDERKVLAELQRDLGEVDISGHRLGTAIFTDKVNCIGNLRFYLIRDIRYVDQVLNELQRQDLLTEEQYNDLMEKTTSQEKMRQLCDIINEWDDPGKYMAYNVLRKYNEETIKHLEMTEKIRRNLPMESSKDTVNFIEHHRSALIGKILAVDPVLRDLRDHNLLTEEQYKSMMENMSSEEKMRELCDIISHWEDSGKDTAYTVLKGYNEEIFTELEKKSRTKGNVPLRGFKDMVTFIDNHRSDLIRGITNVDPILHDLRDQDLLTEEQFNDLMEKTTSQEKMKDLCDIINQWSDFGKLLAYLSLSKHNEYLIQCLELVDSMRRVIPSGSFLDQINFIDSHQSDLIRRIKTVDPVLRDLRDHNLLTEGQYKSMMEKTTSQEKMRELCDIISHWDVSGKYTAYTVLREYNEETIKDLEMMEWMMRNDSLGSSRDRINFVDHHQADLIRRITDVDPILHDLRNQNLLTEQQFNDLIEKTTSQEKMRQLCDIISRWKDIGKFVAYTLLRKHNEKIIKYLETVDERSKNIDQPLFYTNTLNFIERHRSVLIRRITDVDPILRDLREQDLLTEEQFKYVMEKTTSQEKMKVLCDIISLWEDREKPLAYNVLRKYNQGLIKDLEMTDKTKSSTPTVSLLGEMLDLMFVKPSLGQQTDHSHSASYKSPEDHEGPFWFDSSSEQNYEPQAASVPSSVDSERKQKTEQIPSDCMKMTVDYISCKLCGKELDLNQELVEVASMTGDMYRLELKSPGLYRCQKTGIKFLVKGPVILEYKVDSWSDHLKHIPDTYETLGPLFNIKTSGDPSAMSAVHLPHYLCLQSFDEDSALIKCAHFNNGNLTLMQPTRVDTFHIIVENPTFSCLGPLLSIRKKKIPIHGIVLIYFTILCKGDPAEEYRIHLYVLPYSRNAEEILDEKNRKDGYQRINKPEQTKDPVSKNVKYLVTGRPGVSVRPQTVKFQSEPYHKTEIHLKEKDVDVALSVSEESTEDSVWDAQLRQSDIKNIAQLLPQLTPHEGRSGEHFVDRRRKDLIENISSVAEVLDDLKQNDLLTKEGYDNVLTKSTSQDQMRELYRYVGSWDHADKDLFYQALERCNPSTIRKLKRK